MARLVRILLISLTTAAALACAGCPSPISAIDFTSPAIDLDVASLPYVFEVWNANPAAGDITIRINPTRAWIKTDVREVDSAAPPTNGGPFDKRTVHFTIDRSQLRPGESAGEIELSGDGVVSRSVVVPVPIEAIDFTNSAIDFGLNTRPYVLDVWNTNPAAGNLEIFVRPNRPWIKTDVKDVTSAAPTSASGPFDLQSVRITIDRTQLGVGEYTGQIAFVADGVVARAVSVHVVNNQSNDGAALNLENLETNYHDPYLVEFSFALRDANSEAVVAEPSQFTLTAQENDSPVTFENGLHLRRGAARQIKAELLLDYSLTMQAVPGAIRAMENAAINIFLPALNSDALVGVTEFHAETEDAQRVSQFTTNRDLLAERIRSIQEDYVAGFASFSRIFDSILQVAQYFDPSDPNKEDRYIVLFSDGTDTSSVTTANQAIRACTDRGIKVYTVGIGAEVDETTLTNLAVRTGGLYFPSDTAEGLADAFTRVVNDLEAQYTVRWATGKRGDANSFYPEFTLKLGTATVTHQSEILFQPDDVAGDPLRGELFFVASDNPENKTVFLRAQYVPRNIAKFTIDVSATQPFVLAKVDTAQDGLLGDWTMTVTNTGPTAKHIVLTGPIGKTLPFASFGPLLRFDFDDVIDPENLPFDSVTVDNSYANGQFFVVDGF